MKTKFPHLCQPITLGRVAFRNRMFSAPMGGTDITADCSVGPRTPGFYELRAKGGAAAVTASELVVHPQTDASHMFHINLTTPGNLAGWTFLADAVARHGAVPSVELSHSGQYAGTYLVDKDKKKSLTQFGPSDWVRPDGIPVKALTKEQIADIVKSYGEAATLAKRVGFQMVMVHGGHGWLVNQFLSPAFNHRTDEYGGSFENRLRFAREVLTEVRKAVGSGFPIEFRMSGAELFDGGYTLEDGVKIAQGVEDLVDLIHVSAGSYQFGFFTTHLPMFAPHGNNVYLAAEIKKHVHKPVATIGALNDPAQMEEIIASGKADVVEMARALLADPFLPNKVMAGQEDEIVRCLRCFTCMAERPTTGTRRCTVNPLIGRECEGTDVLPAARKKKVVVAGGGVSGMKAAITAAQRGHQVILLEKTGELGGILKSEQALPFKYEMYQLGLTFARQMEKEGVEVRLNTPATPELLEQLAPDALILAVGSSPIVPPLPGIDGDNVVVVNNYYLEKEKVADTVVVLGGGLAGCECAVHLGMEGKQVHLVEMRDSLAVDCNIRHRPILMQQVDKYTTVHTGLQGLRVTEEGLVCKDGEGKEVLIPGKTVICAVGQRSNRDTVNELRGCAPFVREIGDCARVSNITNAVYQGYHAALDI
ncbi:MAG TPA: FAD-dependent oxidoreductase [Candidatus Faecousia intestinavium]|nr:FAD-dependent oxidoreductase [Candidatus Faecousia intestinavium]